MLLFSTLEFALASRGDSGHYATKKEPVYSDYTFGCRHPDSAFRFDKIGYEAISLSRHCVGLYF